MNIKSIYEKYHNVVVDEDIIDTIIDLSDKYIYDRYNPDKSIDILDLVCATVSLKETKELKKYNALKKEFNIINSKKNESIIKNNFKDASNYKEKENNIMNEINNIELKLYSKKKKKVTKLDVAKTVNLRTRIPIYELLNETKTSIKNIDNKLTNNIIGQDNAIKEIIKNTKKIKLGLKDNKCYSFMFVGSSGIGKTALAKLYGECLVGLENTIKLDMSEYSEPHSVSKIIGSPPGYIGYDDNKNILEEIRNKPYSVIILDEIEKAHPSVINLFYQILDDSKIKDSTGKEIIFNNVTIIMTSNIGFLDKHIGFNKKSNNIVLSKLKENFNISFINRIDSLIIFDELKIDDIKKIINKKITNLKEKYKKKNINIKINNTIINEIVELSNYQEFGARKIDKIIKNNIENIIIDELLDNKNNIKINTLKQKTLN